jgi:hypothetical protein
MKRQSAFSKALQEAQKASSSEQKNRETVKPLNSHTVEQSNSETVKRGLTKTSFYLRPDQTEKLDDLEHGCKKRTGRRIDRQDIIRALIDNADLESLLQLFGKR